MRFIINQVICEYGYEHILTVVGENNIPELAEWHVYGNEQQGRFLTVYPNRTYANTSNDPTQRVFYGAGLSEDITNNIFKRQLGNKAYELKDHLGNVRVTFSDIKIPTAPFAPPFQVDLLSKAEYFPYGIFKKKL